jgi:hypothetical protein
MMGQASPKRGAGGHRQQAGHHSWQGSTWVQQYHLDLSVARPDHFIAQLLVEHELDGREQHVVAWRDIQMDGVVIR